MVQHKETDLEKQIFGADLSANGRDFEIGVCVGPQEGHAGEPVLGVDAFAGGGKVLRREDANGGGELRAGNFSAHGARSDLNLRVVADAFVFAGFAASHEVEFAAVFREPNRRRDGDAGFAERCQAEVALALDFGGNRGSHGNILTTASTLLTCG